VRKALQQQADGKGEIEWDFHSIDSTTVRLQYVASAVGGK